jgi:prepilin-type N-terminal cleavage/methylation domain-containing protein
MRTNTRLSAFTLIELLTVIAILGILMALVSSGVMSAVNHARRATAGVAVKNIAHAVRAYSIEYGKYPAVAEPLGPDGNRMIIVGEAEALATHGNAGLFNTLRAISAGVNEGHALNPRRQRYFEGNPATSSQPPRGGFADGTLFPPELAGCYLDPWGRQYTVIMDADDDDTLGLGLIYADLAAPGNVLRQNPAVLSLAADGIRGAKGYEGLLEKPGGVTPPDDLLSWR